MAPVERFRRENWPKGRQAPILSTTVCFSMTCCVKGKPFRLVVSSVRGVHEVPVFVSAAGSRRGCIQQQAPPASTHRACPRPSDWTAHDRPQWLRWAGREGSRPGGFRSRTRARRPALFLPISWAGLFARTRPRFRNSAHRVRVPLSRATSIAFWDYRKPSRRVKVSHAMFIASGNPCRLSGVETSGGKNESSSCVYFATTCRDRGFCHPRDVDHLPRRRGISGSGEDQFRHRLH